MAATACSDTGDALSPATADAVGDPVGEAAKPIGTGPHDDSVDEALFDGTVTFQEYEAGVQRTVDCVRDDWGDIATPLRRSDGAFGFALSNTNPDAMAAYDDCRARFLDALEVAWLDDNAPSQEEMSRRQVDYEQCLRDAGYDPANIDEAADESMAASEANERCMVDSGLTVTFEEMPDDAS